MKKAVLGLAILLILLASASASIAQAQSEKPLLLRQPTLSKTQIAFVYGGDIWTVNREGGEATRLTFGPGSNPVPAFRPTGRKSLFRQIRRPHECLRGRGDRRYPRA